MLSTYPFHWRPRFPFSTQHTIPDFVNTLPAHQAILAQHALTDHTELLHDAETTDVARLVHGPETVQGGIHRKGLLHDGTSRLSSQALPPVASRNAVAHFTHAMVKMKAEVDAANDGSGMRNGPSRMDLAVQ